MMKCLVVALFIVVGSLPCRAQYSDQYSACEERANTQLAMDTCASEEAGRVETQRRNIYQELLSKAASDPEAVAKIKAAETAWIAYRDAYVEAMWPAKDKQTEYGTIYPMEADLLWAKLTLRHITDLKELLAGDLPLSCTPPC